MKKVFISYSHENERTKEYVKKLADRLEEYEEVKVILDQYELELGHDMNNFMETAVREADKILVVCDESYKKKADTRKFGAGIETQIISPKVYSSVNQTKVFPLVIDNFSNVPEYLGSRYGIEIINYDLSENKLKEIMCGVLNYKEIEPPKKTKSFFKEMDVKKFEEIEKVEEKLYKYFLKTFEELCGLKNWSRNISRLATCGPNSPIEIIDNFEKFISYATRFNFSTKEKFKRFNIEIQKFSIKLNEMKNLFLEHTIVDTQNDWYKADRFYNNRGIYNSNYDKDLEEYNKWEENLEKYIYNLTYSLTIISEIIREDIDDTFMLYEGKFSYMSGPYGFMEYREIIPTSYTEIDEQENNIEEVRLSSLSIKTLIDYITGDLDKTPKRSGPQLIELFNSFGKRDVYTFPSIGLPGGVSRKQFVEKNLKDFNNTKELKGIIERVVDAREYITGKFNLENVANEINLILVHDGYKLQRERGIYKLTINK